MGGGICDREQALRRVGYAIGDIYRYFGRKMERRPPPKG
jgi:hypothetical protein